MQRLVAKMEPFSGFCSTIHYPWRIGWHLIPKPPLQIQIYIYITYLLDIPPLCVVIHCGRHCSLHCICKKKKKKKVPRDVNSHFCGSQSWGCLVFEWAVFDHTYCMCVRVCRIPLTSHSYTCMNISSVRSLSGSQERMLLDTDLVCIVETCYFDCQGRFLQVYGLFFLNV